jgi:subtilisin family serine protease
MDGAEAAGCAVVFSAGNEGAGGTSIGSPPDRITTATNAYAVGAVDGQVCLANPNNYVIAGFSSRGPSGCDDVTKKPEVSAPGVNVRSSTNGNDNAYGSAGWSGTSMAGPHVSGIFALMRQVNPDIDVSTMKQIIMDTAHDLSTPGEDNNTGWGMVDAYDAVVEAMGTTGVLNHSPDLAGRLELMSVGPNPFNPATRVSFRVPGQARVALRIYDLQGRLVRTVSDEVTSAGVHTATFDGRDNGGREMATGTYFLKIEGAGQQDAQKINLVR